MLQELLLVLEEDGTEVEDNDYFQSLPDNTTFMLLFKGDRYHNFVSQASIMYNESLELVYYYFLFFCFLIFFLTMNLFSSE
jgi:hypothetical protein